MVAAKALRDAQAEGTGLNNATLAAGESDFADLVFSPFAFGYRAANCTGLCVGIQAACVSNAKKVRRGFAQENNVVEIHATVAAATSTVHAPTHDDCRFGIKK